MRLTHYDEHKKRWQINDDYGAVMIDGLNYAVGEAIDKLAAYEDTGYSPLEIKSLESEWNAARAVVDSYRNAEEQGLLMRLPCKVGDTFYYIAGTLRGNEYVASDTVAAIEISDAKPWIIDSCGCHHIEFWFTREEAEAARERQQ